jgi:hypothetical protein
MTMPKIPSDTIALKISTGNNSAGNGGDGYNYGDITNKASINFDPSNKAYGADVKVNTGDHVEQKAYWDAGGANAKAEDYSKAYGGTANSNGDQSNYSGYDTSTRRRLRTTGLPRIRVNKCMPALAEMAETTTMPRVGMLTSVPNPSLSTLFD